MRTSLDAAPPSSVLLRAHAALWSLAGLAAAGFIGWSLVAPPPDAVAVLDRDRPPSVSQRRIETTLSQMSRDVRGLQEKLAAGEDHTHGLLARMTALEEKTQVLSAGPQASAGPVAPGLPGRTEAPERAASITTGAILQRVAAPLAPAGEAAGATDGGGQSTVPAPPPTPKALHAIQLTSASNLDALRLNWSLLSERHRQILGALQTRYRQTPGKPNAPYQLIAGPIRSTADAARICKELAISGVACRATSFSGEAL